MRARIIKELMTMEIWDTYDRNRVITADKMIRGEAFDNGQLHMIVHLCLFDSNERILIQQRQADKAGWADMWDISVGGSALSGETSQAAIKRETKEELGSEIDFEEVRPHLTINYDHGFDDIYIIHKNIAIEDLSLQEEEVQAAKWATKDEILDMISKGYFIPYFPNFIELLFESRNQYGIISRDVEQS